MSAQQIDTRPLILADRAPAPLLAPRRSLRRRVQLQPQRAETRLFHAL